jgi:D-alanyl-D-alanine endopeptidase (penicillin-binding protein 7)
LGRTFPGGIHILVQLMNEKAHALGLSDTKFEDPTGLSDENVSSARDLSELVNAACNYHEICEFSTTRKTTLKIGRRRLRFVNTNALVRDPRWEIGLSKTGYIEDSGRCLVMQVQLAGRPILIVLLNSTGTKTRLADANRIKRWMERSNSKTRKEPATGSNGVGLRQTLYFLEDSLI